MILHYSFLIRMILFIKKFILLCNFEFRAKISHILGSDVVFMLHTATFDAYFYNSSRYFVELMISWFITLFAMKPVCSPAVYCNNASACAAPTLKKVAISGAKISNFISVATQKTCAWYSPFIGLFHMLRAHGHDTLTYCTINKLTIVFFLFVHDSE